MSNLRADVKGRSLVTKGLQSLLDAFGVEIGNRSILATDATRRDRYEARFACFSVAPLAIRLARYSVLLTWKVLFFEQDCQTGQD